MISIQSGLPHGYVMSGAECDLRIGQRCSILSAIRLEGDRCAIEIGDRVQIARGLLACNKTAPGSLIRIGNDTTISGAVISAHEPGRIIIGEDCLLSLDIFMDVSDMHPIYDIASDERVNPARDIVIGDHVWIGMRVTIMKGVTIGSGSIIGTGSVVTNDIPENVVAAGNPARVVRTGARWARDMKPPP